MASKTKREPIIEAKVKAGTAAAALSGYAVTALNGWVDLPEAVSGQIGAVLSAGVAALITGAAAWVTKHTPRAVVRTSQK